ncbi:hypothetical protein BCR41DRAFT_418591 [Lobosporangium transversale]|uniref:Uncharacterized protein n=1 Tax=Lobosporangium transversale TaxID=64571 RepID=A0A1Y2H1T7_9FUNG|nr:hypothetical protein BCR41DRAFT_418591 [Lobosporangium transversale]ORZ28528.1 hypothetical protein BCR41DRAFT_418591 [Lobosporangium transversale]|eukprot:XP_021886213.1 hypothetical protein BCR41DRAFT_418591 [Lobosporangium transversale]
MDDLDMDEAFDFKALSLDEPEERLQKTFEQSFHITVDQQEPITSVEPTTANNSNDGHTTAFTGTTPDNGPWARLPSPSEVNPFQPGVTADMLDAMALDPNHVFKSAQTPFPFPFSVPPPNTTSASGATSGTATTGTETTGASTTASNNNTQQSNNATSSFGSSSILLKGENEKMGDTGMNYQDAEARTRERAKAEEEEDIPQWLRTDEDLDLRPSWRKQQQILSEVASGLNFTSKDFEIGWGTAGGHDLTTTMDSNALFGFSSYPTYETLPISQTIADEMTRKALAAYEAESKGGEGEEGEGGESTPHVKDMGGFAKYGSTTMESQWMNHTNINKADTGTDGSPSLFSSSSSQQQQQQRTNPQQWQNWRSVPDHTEDLDLDLDLDFGSSRIKPTPGFAPAQFNHN